MVFEPIYASTGGGTVVRVTVRLSSESHEGPLRCSVHKNHEKCPPLTRESAFAQSTLLKTTMRTVTRTISSTPWWRSLRTLTLKVVKLHWRLALNDRVQSVNTVLQLLGFSIMYNDCLTIGQRACNQSVSFFMDTKIILSMVEISSRNYICQVLTMILLLSVLP